MFGSHFYHATVRKSVAVFGTIFNNIKVARKKGDGSLINQIKVPLSYGPKQKFLSRLDSETGQDASIAIKLPRMGFEITGIELDTSKKLSKRAQIIEPGTTGTTTQRNSIKQFAPYDINMQLNIMAKNQDDGLQILEQILPYFQPEYTVSIKPVDDFTSFKQDVPIILNSVSFDDQYEGDYNSRRVLIYTLDFTMKMSFYGPATTSKVIREVNIDFSQSAGSTNNISEMDISIGNNDTESSFTVTTSIDNTDFE
tara:strand:+ start:6018 stop:6779 length:762 start_codon:yes stop_codon:yes gene_type:complete